MISRIIAGQGIVFAVQGPPGSDRNEKTLPLQAQLFQLMPTYCN